MSTNFEEMAMLDIAEQILRESNEPVDIHILLKQVLEKKMEDSSDIDRLTQLYLDITQSAKFVFCGDDLWTLKEGNLDLWDKDGYAFIKQEELVDDADEDDIDFTEFVLEDESASKKTAADLDDDEIEEIDEEALEESEYIDMELPVKSTDDDDIDDEVEIDHFDEDESYDEDDYNEIMDDYEDMYDE